MGKHTPKGGHNSSTGKLEPFFFVATTATKLKIDLIQPEGNESRRLLPTLFYLQVFAEKKMWGQEFIDLHFGTDRL